MKPGTYFVLGNEACAEGAIYAGCRFFAGYPITPATEIAEYLSINLPRIKGYFLQLEDEIAAICSVIGASWAGAKAMTATSGPGFSLMQEANTNAKLISIGKLGGLIPSIDDIIKRFEKEV